MDERSERIKRGFKHVVAPDRPNEAKNREAGKESKSSKAPKKSEKEFSKPRSAPWVVEISPNDLKKLIKGFSPRDMDDKWAIQTEGPNRRGDYMVHFRRSWTSYPIVAINVHAEFNDSGRWKAGTRPRIVQMFWETDTKRWNVDQKNAQAEAKEVATNLCRGLFDVTLR
jgi:hypothetical protein